MIIVAEDEPLIRMMISELLAEAGFEIVEAEHAEEAMTILTLRAAEIKVLFTDIHMPGSMDGLELAHHTHGLWPWISLIVTSGKARPQSHEMPAGSRFISKPYNPDHVVGHVRELLDTA